MNAMRRRGFLGRLLAIAAAPVVAKEVGALEYLQPGIEIDTPAGEWQLEVVEPFGFSDIGETLKQAYPPGSFDEAVNQESGLRKAMR